jgi:hypothetical protein
MLDTVAVLSLTNAEALSVMIRLHQLTTIGGNTMVIRAFYYVLILLQRRLSFTGEFIDCV